MSQDNPKDWTAEPQVPNDHYKKIHVAIQEAKNGNLTFSELDLALRNFWDNAK